LFATAGWDRAAYGAADKQQCFLEKDPKRSKKEISTGLWALPDRAAWSNVSGLTGPFSLGGSWPGTPAASDPTEVHNHVCFVRFTPLSEKTHNSTNSTFKILRFQSLGQAFWAKLREFAKPNADSQMVGEQQQRGSHGFKYV